MSLKCWLGICLVVGVIGGVAEWWLMVSTLEGGPLGPTVALVAAPMAVLVMLGGYGLVGEREKQQALVIGPLVTLLAGAITWFCYLVDALSSVNWD